MSQRKKAVTTLGARALPIEMSHLGSLYYSTMDLRFLDFFGFFPSPEIASYFKALSCTLKTGTKNGGEKLPNTLVVYVLAVGDT